MNHELALEESMEFRLSDLTGTMLEAAARLYDERGFIIVDGVEESITRRFKPLVAERLQVPLGEFEEMLNPDSPPVILPVEARKRMSRIDSTRELSTALLSTLEPLLERLIGGLLHVSSTFHGQFKGGDVKPVDHGGYDPNAQYLEVQGQYLIHQDFAGAAMPTSPCGVTLWTPLNSSPDWNLRLYPGSHRHGLICQEWLKLDDPRLASFGEPVDVPARAGSCVIFNSLLLHSSSKPGPRRRVSCDIRFFPVTGFLPSRVHLIGRDPLAVLREGLARNDGPTLKAPHMEVAAFFGLMKTPELCMPHSILNWANYLAVLLSGRPDEALTHLGRFVNLERGVDTLDAFASKFHNREIHRDTLIGLLHSLRAGGSDAPEVESLGRRWERPAVVN